MFIGEALSRWSQHRFNETRRGALRAPAARSAAPYLESATSVADTLLEYAGQGNILLYATHDLELAKRAGTVMRLQGKSFQKAN